LTKTSPLLVVSSDDRIRFELGAASFFVTCEASAFRFVPLLSSASFATAAVRAFTSLARKRRKSTKI
ncbi:unnamed protein product, partial [Rotaria magnacalcarata]